MSKTRNRLSVVLTALLLMGISVSQTFDWETIGQQTYNTTCASCHQLNGQGIEGAFPPLAGHAVDIFAAAGGRDFLMNAVLHGLQGEITVDGTTYSGSMPAWKSTLSDEQAAAVLNFVLTSWGNEDQLAASFEPYVPDEAASVRGEDRSAQDVHALRAEVMGQAANDDTGSSTRSVQSGVYNQDQAQRGADLFQEACASCHAPTLAGSEAGPGLVGGRFDFGWNGKSLGELFAYTSANMPQNDPGGLKPEEYADVIAYILQENGYPSADGDADSGLQPDPERLRSIVIED